MIGILDSGVGGLAIYGAIKKCFPTTKVVYFADNANFPYGTKKQEALLDIVEDAIKKLLFFDCRIIVLACNTATVAAIKQIRSFYPEIFFIGVEPAVKPAADYSKSGVIGLIATERTCLDHNSDKLVQTQKVIRSQKTDLVRQIELDITLITDKYLRESIDDLVESGVDSIVLGCTHYIFVKDRLAKLYPEIQFFEPSDAIANRLQEIVNDNKLELPEENDIFLTSGEIESFRKKAQKLLNVRIEDVRRV